MSEMAGAERRDISGVLADLRVGVAEIKTTQGIQSKTLERMEERLNVAILRDEFNAFKTTNTDILAGHAKAIEGLRTEHDKQAGASATWRLVFSGALALLTVVVAVVGALRP